MIDVVRDTEGLRLAITEILEQSFDQARILRSMETASAETRNRLLASVPPLTLSPGYHAAAHHLMQLEAEGEAGLPLAGLARWEGDGLLVLKQARSAHHVRHPSCTTCGARQDTRFQPKCVACGVEFRRKQ